MEHIDKHDILVSLYKDSLNIQKSNIYLIISKNNNTIKVKDTETESIKTVDIDKINEFKTNVIKPNLL